jgi:hypothetical protein
MTTTSPTGASIEYKLTLTGRHLHTFLRYRWRGEFAVKCDLGAAISARARLGGRVDRSAATLLTNGTLVLAPWQIHLPWSPGTAAGPAPAGAEEEGRAADPDASSGAASADGDR